MALKWRTMTRKVRKVAVVEMGFPQTPQPVLYIVISFHSLSRYSVKDPEKGWFPRICAVRDDENENLDWNKKKEEKEKEEKPKEDKKKK